MSISEIDDPFAPWGELLTFGNPWHGKQDADGLKRLDGIAMTLPEGVTHHRVEDGGARLIDFGIPAPEEMSEAEKAAGITWWNKAILAGSGLSLAAPHRVYNPVRGAQADALLFRSVSWPVRCQDGTVYMCWYSPDKLIRVAKLEQPYPTIPENTTGGVNALTLGSAVVDSVVVGTGSHQTFKWINFSPSGRRAALHVAYINLEQIIVVHQIIEFDIASGSTSEPPVVAITQARTGQQLTTFSSDFSVVEIREQAMDQVDFGQEFLVQSDDPNIRRERIWGRFEPSGTPYSGFPKTCSNGVDASSTLQTLVVTYDGAGNRVELGFKEEGSQVYTGSIDQPGYAFDYVIDGNGTYISGVMAVKKLEMNTTYAQHSKSYMTRNGAQVGTALREQHQTGVWSHFEEWRGASNVSSGDPNGTISDTSISAGVVPLYGNLIVAVNPGITYDSGRNPDSNTHAVYGYASGDSGVMQSSQLGSFIDIREFAVDPQTGLFTPGVTRYF
ncbi:MAG: hypothetical protein D3M94_07450 [Rhodocyclales bacterium GT-UBC]|nr:MAG: hypothetical protein D3M94_07450 [Rhodocyclales bacterium GT-UBC]